MGRYGIFAQLCAGLSLWAIAGPIDAQTLRGGFAFGADNYTRTIPNSPADTYIKIQQNGSNLNYSAARGYGYVDLSGLDTSPNNRGALTGLDEIYDQFIGVRDGGRIVFRVDVPNGNYRFVLAGGDAQYGGHIGSFAVRNGSSGPLVVLSPEIGMNAKTYISVGFDAKQPPAQTGATAITFLPQSPSPTLTVTQGFIELVQQSPNTGADLCLLEVYAVGSTPTPPVITTHPSAISVIEGGTAVFSVAATGTQPLSYKWFRDGTTISGANSASYSFTALLADDSSSYRAEVSNSVGTALSNAALLTVSSAPAAPTITQQPVSIIVTEGASAGFTSQATGNPSPVLQWHEVGIGAVAGAVSSTLNLGTVALSDDGRQFYMTASNVEGIATSNTATLSVQSAPLPPSGNNRDKLSISGEITDAFGNPIGSPTPVDVDVSVRLFDAPTGGTLRYIETFRSADGEALQVVDGLFAARLGEGSSSGNLVSTLSSHPNLWLEITIEGDTPDVLAPRTPLTASPYAIAP